MQHGLAVAAADDHEVQLLPGQGELGPGDHLGAELVGHLAAGVYQQAVALAAEVEGDVLIGDLRAGAAVLVPHVHHLAVFHEGGEALPQAVELLADVHVELAAHVGALGGLHGAYHGVAEAVADVGDLFAVVVVGEGGGGLGDLQLQPAAFHGEAALKLGDLQGQVLHGQVELGLLFGAAHVVVHLGAEDVRPGGGEEELQHRAPCPAFVVDVGHGVQVDLLFGDLDFPDLHAVGVFHPGEVEPIAFGEFHGITSFRKAGRFCELPVEKIPELLYSISSAKRKQRKSAGFARERSGRKLA